MIYKLIIDISVEYAKSCLIIARKNKHLKGLEDFMKRSNSKYNPAKSMFKYTYGELMGAIKGTHSNVQLAQKMYAYQLSQISH